MLPSAFSHLTVPTWEKEDNGSKQYTRRAARGAFPGTAYAYHSFPGGQVRHPIYGEEEAEGACEKHAHRGSEAQAKPVGVG